MMIQDTTLETESVTLVPVEFNFSTRHFLKHLIRSYRYNTLRTGTEINQALRLARYFWFIRDRHDPSFGGAIWLSYNPDSCTWSLDGMRDETFVKTLPVKRPWAFDAVRIVTEWFFSEHPEVKIIYSGVNVKNRGMICVFKRLGFKYVCSLAMKNDLSYELWGLSNE